MSRIVQLANFYGSTSGGLRVAVDALGAGYRAAGHERVLIVPGEADAEQQTPAGTQLSLVGRRLPGGNGYRLLTDRRQLADVLRGLRPDRIEVSDKLTLGWVGPWAQRHDIPAVLVSHERVDAILAVRFPGWFPLGAVSDRWNARLAAGFDTVVCASAFSAEEFLRIGATNVVRVPLGVDLRTFQPARRAVDPGMIELVCTGRLSAEKLPEVAVDTVRALARMGWRAHLTMLGDGPRRWDIEHQARRLDVTLAGHVTDRGTLAQAVAGADVALSPCPYESFGLSTLEALAAGTPVVVADAGALPELIHAGCGRAAPPDGESFAARVVDLLTVPRETLRASARRRAERFPWQRTIRSMLSVHGLSAEGVAA